MLNSFAVAGNCYSLVVVDNYWHRLVAGLERIQFVTGFGLNHLVSDRSAAVAVVDSQLVVVDSLAGIGPRIVLAAVEEIVASIVVGRSFADTAMVFAGFADRLVFAVVVALVSRAVDPESELVGLLNSPESS